MREDGKPVGKIRLVLLGTESSNLAETPIGANPQADDTSPGIAIIADDYLPVEEQIDYLREHLRDFIQRLEGGRFVSLVAPASRVAVEARVPGGLDRLNTALDRLHASTEFRRVFFPSSSTPVSPAEILALEASMRNARLAAIQAACASLSGVAGDRVVVLVASRSFGYGTQDGRAMYERMLELMRSANARLVSLEYVPATTRVPLIPLTTQSAPADPTGSSAARRALSPQRRSFSTDLRASVPLDLSHAVATDTGGFSTRALLATGLAQLATKLGNQYLITYERTRPADGRFHKLEVKVKQRGVEVTHRRGFIASMN